MKDGTIQVGELFTGSSVIDPDFVLLQGRQGAAAGRQPDRVDPRVEGNRDVKRSSTRVNAKLDLEAYNKMATSIDIDKVDPSDAAKTFLEDSRPDDRRDERQRAEADGRRRRTSPARVP